MQAGCNKKLVVLLCRGFKVCKQESKCLHLSYSDDKTFVVPSEGSQMAVGAVQQHMLS